MKLLVLAAALLAGACAKGDPSAKDDGEKKPAAPAVKDPAPPPAKAPPPALTGGPAVVETIDQAVAAKGQQVVVRGTAQREKLGSTIEVEEMSILCVGVDFPDDRIGKPMEAEGTLVVTGQHQATVNDKGEISQGTAPGTKRWVLEGCTVR